MKKLLVAVLAGSSLLALAACGESEKKGESAPASTEQPAAPTQSQATPSTTTTATPATPDASQAIQDAQKALKDATASMTDEQKQQTITAARANAEAAAKAAGQSEDMIKTIGDQAEAAAKQALGVQ